MMSETIKKALDFVRLRDCGALRKKALDDLDALVAENARLRSALEFYADEANYDEGAEDIIGCVVSLDEGARARAALKGGE